MANYQANGEHINCSYSDLLEERLQDDFLDYESIVIVEVKGDRFIEFSDMDDSDTAYEILDELEFNEIDSIDYGDWDALSKILGEKESTSLREIYFYCEDFEEITQAALLYYNKSFVTIFSDY